jgi:hypothetical protein
MKIFTTETHQSTRINEYITSTAPAMVFENPPVHKQPMTKPRIGSFPRSAIVIGAGLSKPGRGWIRAEQKGPANPLQPI